MSPRNPAWWTEALFDKRLQMCAGMVVPGSRVLDVGAGAQTLRSFLPDGCTYTPTDLANRDPLVKLFDLNADAPWPVEEHDVVVLAGVLEWVYDPEQVMRRAAERASFAVATYHPAPHGQRERNGWVSHLTEEELMSAFTNAGWTLVVRTPATRGEVMFSLVRA